MRPFSGRFRTSACETVPAIWLRAASSTSCLRRDGDAGVHVADVERDRQLERGSGRERHPLHGLAEPGLPHDDLVGADLQKGKPESPFAVGGRFVVTFVSVWRALTRAPGTTPPEASVT